MKKPVIIIVAQIPPPFHGQAIMQKIIVDADFNWADKRFIQLDISDSIGSVGKFSWRKIGKVFGVCFKLFRERLKGKIDLIYYPPASPNKVPFYRDLIIIPVIRLLSLRIIFHFHSGGLYYLLEVLNPVEKCLAKTIYNAPDASIILLPSLKNDISWINSKKNFIIPNGINETGRYDKNSKKIFDILFVANIQREKGIETLLDAIDILNNDGLVLKVCIIGGFRDEIYKKLILDRINKLDKGNQFTFLGVISGAEKWVYFNSSRLFCLPTFYKTEAMPVTFLEAMSVGLPIITTKWRANFEIVKDMVNGLLVDPDNPTDLSMAIKVVIMDELLQAKISETNLMEIYNYSISKFVNNVENAIKDTLEIDESFH